MSTQQAQFTTFRIPEKNNQYVDVKSTIGKYLYHWPLFVIGLTISLAGALLYIKTSRPVYDVKATILIKDEKKSPDQQSALHEIDLSSSSKIIENEMEILKSKQLISQVINDLKLWAVYQKVDGLEVEDLYKKSPVKFTMLNAAGSPAQGVLDIVIKDDKSFYIKNADGNLRELKFKDKFKNRFGSWKLEATDMLSQYKGAAIKITVLDPDLLAINYQQAIGVALSNKLATAVILSVEDENPQRGKDVLNQLILNYNLAATHEKNRETKSTLDFIDARLSSLTGELTDAEKGIERFKSTRGLTDISSESRISLENMQSNDTRLNEVNVKLSIIEGIERYINSSHNLGRAPATMGIEDPALSSMIEKLSQLQLQKDKLLATSPETNPDFDPINRQMQTTREAIKENVKNIRTALLSARNKLQSFNSNIESSIKNIPIQEREFISIKRQQAIKENLYTYLLQKREEVSVSYASAVTDDRVVDHAYAGPPKGGKLIALTVAVLLGIFLPAGLIYARNSLKDVITSPHDIKGVVDIPVLAEIPLQSASAGGNDGLTDPRGAISERIRALRTRLYYSGDEHKMGRTTLVTSSVPGEGKSFISSNLAYAMSCTDRKTIILELDMRKPKIAETFGLPKGVKGVSDYLMGKVKREDIIQRYQQNPNLHVISCGTAVKNPAELLEKSLFKDLIVWLRENYDDILIDSPPAHFVPEPLILSQVTDVTLYVIRQGFTRKSELGFIKDLYSQGQLKNMNIVFNGVHSSRYGYGYDYKNDYYGSEEKRSAFASVFADFSTRF